MTDLAEIRAEGRRLVAEYRRVTESPREYYERVAAGSRWAKWVQLHADVLLADPAPVGLTEDRYREALERIAHHKQNGRPFTDIGEACDYECSDDLRAIARDALAAVPASPSVDPEEEKPVCSHAIYHHGCPSCDRQDPEDREEGP